MRKNSVCRASYLKNPKIQDRYSDTQIIIKKTTFFLPRIRMSGKGEFQRRQKNQKNFFYKNKKIFKIDDIDVNKILVSKEEPYGKKN